MLTLGPAVHTCDPVVAMDDENPYSMIGDPDWREIISHVIHLEK